MGASKNRGTPKSSISIGVFHCKPSILGVYTPIFVNTDIIDEKEQSLRRENTLETLHHHIRIVLEPLAAPVTNTF